MGNPIRRHGGNPPGNFTQIRNTLIRRSGLKAAESVVLNVLLSHDDGWQVTQETIGKDVGLSRPAVKRALDGLCSKRKLIIEDGKRGQCVFHVNPLRDFTVDEVAKWSVTNRSEGSPTSVTEVGNESLPSLVTNHYDKEHQKNTNQKTKKKSSSPMDDQRQEIRALIDLRCPGKDRNHLTNVAAKAIREGTEVTVGHVETALLQWVDNNEADPNCLADYIHDAKANDPLVIVRELIAACDNGGSVDTTRLDGHGFWFPEPEDVPADVETVAQTRDFMRQAKRVWLAGVHDQISERQAA